MTVLYFYGFTYLVKFVMETRNISSSMRINHGRHHFRSLVSLEDDVFAQHISRDQRREGLT